MARLDQTGVFGSTCRHVIPPKLLNMFQGEIFAYAHCMHSYGQRPFFYMPGREEVITRLVSFWGTKKVKSLLEYLTRRYRKVRKWLLRLKKTLPSTRNMTSLK
ncbi:unnamed protein product [Owenia fusiformis]|uniref:Uncharacterized protein n=1 Tax=Owenia fusiformis TaxID=6347 RepID=A0A8J1XN66_OWEFU|nr:unnamed protein product [Owenia fusiformis]